MIFRVVPFWENWIFWLYFAAWVPFTLTALNYGFRARWWTSGIGRSLLLTIVSILAVLTNVLLILIFPDYEWLNLNRTLLMGGVIVAGWYQFSAILRVLRAADQAERDLLLASEHEEKL